MLKVFINQYQYLRRKYIKLIKLNNERKIKLQCL